MRDERDGAEDSVAAVDAADKATVYTNWAGLMRGDLATTMSKGGETITRALNPDRSFHSVHGGASTLTLPGRAVLLVRNVGIHMYTEAVTTADGSAVPEGIVDALATVLAALPDLRKASLVSNSRTGSVYIVKPKMHGPEEVAFVASIFAAVEETLELPPCTVKLGIMDEERRTTVCRLSHTRIHARLWLYSQAQQIHLELHTQTGLPYGILSHFFLHSIVTCATGQPERMYPGGIRPGGLHQHWLPGPDGG